MRVVCPPARATRGSNSARDRRGVRNRRRHLPEAEFTEPDGGYFVWLELADEVDASALLGRATEAGVTFVRGADFFVDAGGASDARLAFSYEPPERIAEGVRLLASLL